jgi:hypothetical protein
MVRKVSMKEAAPMALRLLVLVNMQKRCLQESKHERQVHQDGNRTPHILIVPSNRRKR